MDNPTVVSLKISDSVIDLTVYELNRIHSIIQTLKQDFTAFNKIWGQEGSFICAWLDLHAKPILLSCFQLSRATGLTPFYSFPLLRTLFEVMSLRQWDDPLAGERDPVADCIHTLRTFMECSPLPNENKQQTLTYYKSYYAKLLSRGRRSLTLLATDHEGRTELDWAIQTADKVRQAQIEQALCRAIYHGHNFLIKEGDTLDISLALHLAIKSEQNAEFAPLIYEILKIPGVYNRQCDDKKQTALHVAIAHHRLDLVGHMLACSDIDLYCWDAQGLTPVKMLIQQEGSQWCSLQRYSACIFYVLFFWGERLKSTEEAQRLSNPISRNEDINAVNAIGCTVLHSAAVTCLPGMDKIVAALCAHPDIDLLAIDYKGTTPLDLAILYKNKQVQVEFAQALCRAIGERCHDSVSTDVKPTDMEYILLHAIEHDMESCQPFICELLKVLWHGEPYCENHLMVTSQSPWSAVKKSTLCLLVGKAYGRIPDTIEHALWLASKMGRADLVQTILTRTNVDIEAASFDGRQTALEVATQYGHQIVVDILTQAKANYQFFLEHRCPKSIHPASILRIGSLFGSTAATKVSDTDITFTQIHPASLCS